MLILTSYDHSMITPKNHVSLNFLFKILGKITAKITAKMKCSCNYKGGF